VSGTSLVEGLREIARRRAEGVAPRAIWTRPAPLGGTSLVATDLPGAETMDVEGASILVVTRRVADLLPGVDVAAELIASLDRIGAADPETIDRGLIPARGMRVTDLAVLDLETTGFWGCPVLLVGLLHEEDGILVTRQIVARDYPEERPMLRAALDLLARRRLVVTFNGKSYDVPCLRERCIVHRVKDDARRRLAHVDVLHAARRRWRGCFEDCRLATLERHVTGLTRAGDVPSREVPELLHRFVATGDAALLAPVLHHGRVDLLTTARLFARLGA
jgi:uncharacterized protein YprB with RNaseH-like and TPR domain